MAPPASYSWLTASPAPRMIKEAIGLWHSLEQSSAGLSTMISKWESECLERLKKPVILDPVPLAGTFIAVIARRSRKTLPPAPHCALNWARFGVEAGQPQLGDILCFTREGGGYVGLYVGEDDAAYHILGADSSDRIAIDRLPKHHLYAARRPVYQDFERAIKAIRLERDGTMAAVAA